MLNLQQSKQLLRLRWIAFAIVALAYVLSFFHRFAPAAISGDLQQTFHASGAELGGLAATYFYVYMVMQIPTGILVDTLGPRRVVAIGGIKVSAASGWFAARLAGARANSKPKRVSSIVVGFMAGSSSRNGAVFQAPQCPIAHQQFSL